MEKPSNVQTAGILLLIGGIWSLIYSFVMTLSSLFLCVPSYTVGVTAAIMSIVQGSRLLGSNSYGMGTPKATAIMQILQILQFDIVGMTLGIIALTMFNDAETTAWLEGRGGYSRAGFTPSFQTSKGATTGYGGQTSAPNYGTSPAQNSWANNAPPAAAPSWASSPTPAAPPASLPQTAPTIAPPSVAPPAVAPSMAPPGYQPPPSQPAGTPGLGTAPQGWKTSEAETAQELNIPPATQGYEPAQWGADVDAHGDTAALQSVSVPETQTIENK